MGVTVAAQHRLLLGRSLSAIFEGCQPDLNGEPDRGHRRQLDQTPTALGPRPADGP